MYREKISFSEDFSKSEQLSDVLSVSSFCGLENASYFLIFSHIFIFWCLTAFPWIVSYFSASLFTRKQTQCPTLQQRQAEWNRSAPCFLSYREFFLMNPRLVFFMAAPRCWLICKDFNPLKPPNLFICSAAVYPSFNLVSVHLIFHTTCSTLYLFL